MNEEVKNTNSSWSYLPLVLIVTCLIFFAIAICELVTQPDTGFILLLIALLLLGKYFWLTQDICYNHAVGTSRKNL